MTIRDPKVLFWPSDNTGMPPSPYTSQPSNRRFQTVDGKIVGIETHQLNDMVKAEVESVRAEALSVAKQAVADAVKIFRDGDHSFAVEALDTINRALTDSQRENDLLREDRAKLRGENAVLRETNMRLQEQILRLLEATASVAEKA